jgi:hypothetical protein
MPPNLRLSEAFPRATGACCGGYDFARANHRCDGRDRQRKDPASARGRWSAAADVDAGRPYRRCTSVRSGAPVIIRAAQIQQRYGARFAADAARFNDVRVGASRDPVFLQVGHDSCAYSTLSYLSTISFIREYTSIPAVVCRQ